MSLAFLISWSVMLVMSMVLFSLSVSPYAELFFSLDPLSASLLWLTSGVIFSMVAGASLNVMWTLWYILIGVLLLSFCVSSLFHFYILFEMSLIPILIMILSQGNQPERLSAGGYLILYTMMISVPYLSVVLMLGGPSQNMSMISSFTVTQMGSLLLLVPFLVKMPMLGIHFWLPKAHVEANTAGSMVLAGLLLKLGSFGAVRISCVMNFGLSLAWSASIWVMLSFLSGLITFLQTDLKKMVAYSSVTHMTLMIIGFTTNNKLLVVSVLLVSLSHGWVAMGLFLVAGAMSHNAGSRLSGILGSESSLNWFILIVSIFLMANASVPPMPSFFSELFMVFSALMKSGSLVLVFLGLSIVVCYYNAYIFLTLSHLKPISTLPSSLKLTDGASALTLLMTSVESLVWLRVI